jgi:hypothetical protein
MSSPRAATNLPWREMLIAETDGRSVGYMEIIDPAEEEEHYWGDAAPRLRALDIWIGEESDLNRGFGAAMMRLALALLRRARGPRRADRSARQQYAGPPREAPRTFTKICRARADRREQS